MEIHDWELVSPLENETGWFCVWCCAWFPDNISFSGHFITSPLCRAVHDKLFEKQDGHSNLKPLQCLACYKTFPTQVASTRHYGLVIECQQKIHEYLRSTIGPKPLVENREPSIISDICFDSQLTNDELMNVLLAKEQTVDNKDNSLVSNTGNNVIGLNTELKQFEINRQDDGSRLKQCELSLDPEKKERKRLRDLERKRFIRNNLDESEKIKRRLLDSEKKRIMRANMDEVEKERRRRLEAERKRNQRAKMDEGEKARLRKLEAERQRVRRATMDKTQQTQKRQKNAKLNRFQQSINSI